MKYVCVSYCRYSPAVGEYSLPEFSNGGGEVGDIGSQPECLVLADCVLHTVYCVPRLIAFGPGEVRLKALKQVVESPGQDHDVVDVQ